MNKKYELLKNLKRGDILINGDVIQCVVRSDCIYGKAKLVKIIDKNFINAEKAENNAKIEGFRDLFITPWHPIKSITGVWAFPNDIRIAEEMKCDAVYSFLVLKSHAGTLTSNDSCHINSGSHGVNGDMIIVRDVLTNEKEESIYASTIRINGIECAALAHGIPGKEVISHPFYGTLKVEKELRKCRGWNVGLVHFRTAPSPSPFLFEIGNSAVQLESTCSINNQFDFDGDMLRLSNDRTSDAPYVLDQQYGKECSGCVLKDARTGLANGFVLTLEV